MGTDEVGSGPRQDTKEATMKKKTHASKRSKTPPKEMRAEYALDYRKARPNRFAKQGKRRATRSSKRF
jgi:hypothetical protein